MATSTGRHTKATSKSPVARLAKRMLVGDLMLEYCTTDTMTNVLPIKMAMKTRASHSKKNIVMYNEICGHWYSICE
ncbi:hypothetical protein HOLleu_15167 [Holothuria leucospilota]|uniref:Uncharacterized protein n=1 Tax=Holothuria leucospilota TaxID=206669 RepID=A0A9Q1HD34_HOLLE|nr:hypothetical protein HOLleu_15167 [Holothuria leucospilota]